MTNSASDVSAPTVLVTGASRGIGLEFVRQYAADGWKVIATARRPEGSPVLMQLAQSFPSITLAPLDVTDAGQRLALRERLAGQPVDVLLHNAGIAPGGSGAASNFGTLDCDLGRQALDTNVWGTLQLTEALVENVAASRQRKVMILSSAVGSVSLARAFGDAGGYPYRISKAALNMAGALLARDLETRGITVGLLSPGQVDTDLGGGHPGTPASQLVPVETSVAGLRAVIAEFTPERNGHFYRHTGAEIAW